MTTEYGTDGPTPDFVKVKVIGSDVKPAKVINTSFKTWVLDTAGVAGPKNVQICDYEPNRVRIVIRAVDDPVMVCLETPTLSPDTDLSATTPPRAGLYIPISASYATELFGPDALWINTIGSTGATRVTVVKEYAC